MISDFSVERVMGIEPTRPAWKAGILPLNYTRIRDLNIISQMRYLVKCFFNFFRQKDYLIV